jgi:hypothetical protein
MKKIMAQNINTEKIQPLPITDTIKNKDDFFQNEFANEKLDSSLIGIFLPPQYLKGKMYYQLQNYTIISPKNFMQNMVQLVLITQF